jgi:hypothetical protein
MALPPDAAVIDPHVEAKYETKKQIGKGVRFLC